MLTRVKAGLLIALTLLLVGCGFQLRGGANLAPELQELALTGDNKSQFYRIVAARLERAGARIVPASPTTPVIAISGLGRRNTVASVSNRADALEYVMGFDTRFVLTMPDESVQVFKVAFNRSFLNKSTQALASSREQAQLHQQMEFEAAEQLVRHLNRLTF